MFTSIDRLSPICLGHELDNETAIVCVDCTAWIVAFPQLTDYRIEVVRPDGAAYVASNVTLDGNTLTWRITDADTAVGGNGSYQIVATGKDGERKTSNAAKVFVLDNLPEMTEGEPPEPERPWYDKVIENATKAEEAAKRAESAVAHSPTIGENGNWWLWDVEAQKYVDSGVSSGGSSGVSSEIVLTDASTSKDYRLYVNSGKLTMEVVE